MSDSPANDAPFRLIDDVEFGEDVTVWSFSNLYGCHIGSRNRIGSFVEVQRGASIGRARKISTHQYSISSVRHEIRVTAGTVSRTVPRLEDSVDMEDSPHAH